VHQGLIYREASSNEYIQAVGPTSPLGYRAPSLNQQVTFSDSYKKYGGSTWSLECAPFFISATMLIKSIVATTLARTAIAACDRTCGPRPLLYYLHILTRILVLNDWTALYLSAQTAGNYALLTETLFSNLTYTEQFKPANISGGILSKPLNIMQYRSVLDEVLCTAFTEITVTDISHPYVIPSIEITRKTLILQLRSGCKNRG